MHANILHFRPAPLGTVLGLQWSRPGGMRVGMGPLRGVDSCLASRPPEYRTHVFLLCIKHSITVYLLVIPGRHHQAALGGAFLSWSASRKTTRVSLAFGPLASLSLGN
jgi:hypothetical protein